AAGGGLVRRGFIVYGSLAVAVVVVDQWIKYLVETGLELHERIGLLPFLSLFRTHNTGVAFSMLSGGGWGLIAMVAAATTLICWLAWKSEPRQVIARFGFTLIIAGAIGNVIDRLLLGYVVDYVL